MAVATAIGPEVESVPLTMPYRVEVEIEGVADLLLHRYLPESVETKAKAAKGSTGKKTDDVDSYVYRNENNEICIPGEYLRRAIVTAAKFKQDPRSPRKSAMDLMNAALIPETHLASLGKTKWDYLDQRRVQVQRNGVTRIRPAILKGWRLTFVFSVTLPEYVSPQFLNGLIGDAGRLIGIADFRPTYGRFNVVRFDVLE